MNALETLDSGIAYILYMYIEVLMFRWSVTVQWCVCLSGSPSSAVQQ